MCESWKGDRVRTVILWVAMVVSLTGVGYSQQAAAVSTQGSTSGVGTQDLSQIILRIEKGEGRGNLAPLVEAAAAAGDDRATMWLAHYYTVGYFPYAKDVPKGVELAKKSLPGVMKLANEGDAEALCLLGRCYRYEVGVKRDLNKAFEYSARAADKGQVTAMGDLARLYLRGHGVAPDLHKARQLAKEAAERGSYFAPRAMPDMKKFDRDDTGRLESLRTIPLVRILGLSKTDGLAFLRREKVVSSEPVTSRRWDDEIIYFPEDGILLQVDISGRIMGVEGFRKGFHDFSQYGFEKSPPPSGQYRGPLPFGLCWTNTVSDIEAEMGSPDDDGDVQGDGAYGMAYLIDPVTLSTMFSYSQTQELLIWRVFERWSAEAKGP